MDTAPIPGPDTLAVPLTVDLPVDLDAVRARRASLRLACARVRQRLDGTAADLLEVVTDLDRLWATHTAETEGADGMLGQVLVDCPRLAPVVLRLRREHETVAADLREVGRRLAATPAGAAELHDVVRTLAAVEAHRRASRELIYDAYHVDVGLGE
jgi:hypothetical protein